MKRASIGITASIAMLTVCIASNCSPQQKASTIKDGQIYWVYNFSDISTVQKIFDFFNYTDKVGQPFFMNSCNFNKSHHISLNKKSFLTFSMNLDDEPLILQSCSSRQIPVVIVIFDKRRFETDTKINNYLKSISSIAVESHEICRNFTKFLEICNYTDRDSDNINVKLAVVALIIVIFLIFIGVASVINFIQGNA